MRNYINILLKKLAGMLHIDTSYLARGGFWITINFILSSLLSLAVVVAFANLLPPDAYGRYKYIISITGLFGFLTLSGMNTAVTQAVARGYENTLRYAVRFQLKWNILVSIASSITAIYYYTQQTYILAFSIFIVGVIYPFTSAYNTFGAYLLAKKTFRTLTTYNIITNLFNTVPLILVLFFTDNIIALVITYALGGLVPNLYFYFRTLNKYKPSKTRLKEEEKKIMSYGTHLSVLAGFSNIANNIDKIIIFHFLGAIQVAIYSLAIAVPNRIGGYIKNLGAILLPKLSERKLDVIDSVFYIRVIQSIAIGLIMTIGYILISPHLFKWFLPQYIESIRYSQLFSLSFIFMVTGNYIGNIFRAHRMLRANYLGMVLSVARTGFYLVLGTQYGILGIIWAHLIGQAIGFITSIILWKHEYARVGI